MEEERHTQIFKQGASVTLTRNLRSTAQVENKVNGALREIAVHQHHWSLGDAILKLPNLKEENDYQECANNKI